MTHAICTATANSAASPASDQQITERTDGGWRFEHTYASLSPEFYQQVNPAPAPNPKMVILNEELALRLGLDADALLGTPGARWLGGTELPPGAKPIAQAYAGHQYGHQTMLGDGRAILLGEQIAPDGARFDIQLKGSGRTRFSRNGDGKAALGPMLREFLISEAMHAFGIPTTRSLAVVLTGESVWRQREHPGAVLTRVAASHIRFGTFEYAAALPDTKALRSLADYTIWRHYPELQQHKHPHCALFLAILQRQAALVARWMAVGFVHGVMNTDNMSVAGETIDFGPCAFLDAYHPETVFSSIDHYGRYAYGRQPEIVHWNLARLAEAMLELFAEDHAEAVERANEMLKEFPGRFRLEWRREFAAKLGISDANESDDQLIEELLLWMRDTTADFTNTFRLLANVQYPSDLPVGLAGWGSSWLERLRQLPGGKEAAVALMKKVNPVLIPRNHRVEEAFSAAEAGNFEPFHRLLRSVRRPFEELDEFHDLCDPPPPGTPPYVTFCGT